MGISPSGEYHAIVITRHEGSVMEYFDPQNRTYGQITQEQLDDYTARNGKSSFFFELEEVHRQCFILVKDGNGKKKMDMRNIIVFVLLFCSSLILSAQNKIFSV